MVAPLARSGLKGGPGSIFLWHVLFIVLVEAERVWARDSKRKGHRVLGRSTTLVPSCPLSSQEDLCKYREVRSERRARNSSLSGCTPTWHSTGEDEHSKCAGNGSSKLQTWWERGLHFASAPFQVCVPKLINSHPCSRDTYEAGLIIPTSQDFQGSHEIIRLTNTQKIPTVMVNLMGQHQI